MLKKILISIVLIVVIGGLAVYAESAYFVSGINGRGYKLPMSSPLVSVYEYNICKNVQNENLNYGAFIPTNSSSEWTSVINNPGQSLSISSCNSANNQLDWTVANNGQATCTFGNWSSNATFDNKGATPITLTLVSGSHTGMGGNATYSSPITIPAYSTKTTQIVSVPDAGATVTTPYFCSHAMDRIDTINYTYTDPTTGQQTVAFIIEYQQ